MSFGTGNDRAGRRKNTSKKKQPKPKKGGKPAKLDECSEGEIVMMRVKVYRWVAHDGSVFCRPLGERGEELQPLHFEGGTGVAS